MLICLHSSQVKTRWWLSFQSLYILIVLTWLRCCMTTCASGDIWPDHWAEARDPWGRLGRTRGGGDAPEPAPVTDFHTHRLKGKQTSPAASDTRSCVHANLPPHPPRQILAAGEGAEALCSLTSVMDAGFDSQGFGPRLLNGRHAETWTFFLDSAGPVRSRLAETNPSLGHLPSWRWTEGTLRLRTTQHGSQTALLLGAGTLRQNARWPWGQEQPWVPADPMDRVAGWPAAVIWQQALGSRRGKRRQRGHGNAAPTSVHSGEETV